MGACAPKATCQIRRIVRFYCGKPGGFRRGGKLGGAAMCTTAGWRLALSVAAFLVAWNPCLAGMTWFDETNGGSRYANFGALADAYDSFMGTPSHLITFDNLVEWTVLKKQYQDSDGLTFQHGANGKYTPYSGVHPEGGAIVQDVTGYDGSYMPNGNNVYVRFSNDQKGNPLTLLFDSPVSSIGAFVGMGVEGSIHTLDIRAYDESKHLIASRTLESWLWESTSHWQNYESFFGLRADSALISRVEILNNATTDFANALILDNVAFGSGPAVPEPATAALLAAAFAVIVRKGKPRIHPAA